MAAAAIALAAAARGSLRAVARTQRRRSDRCGDSSNSIPRTDNRRDLAHIHGAPADWNTAMVIALPMLIL